MSPVVILLGLNGAGKTKILYTLKLGQLTDQTFREVEFEPTSAFNFEVVPWFFDKTNFRLKIWDLGGSNYVRPMWKHFYVSTPPDAVFFVVDDGDNGRARLDEAREAFQQILHEPSLLESIKIVLVNIRDEQKTVAEFQKEAEQRWRDGLGLMDSAIAADVRVFGVRLGKSREEDKNIFNAVNYLCHRYKTINKDKSAPFKFI